MAPKADSTPTPIPAAPSSGTDCLPQVPPRDPKIVTSYWAKPIPVRQFDWTATYDGDEPNDAGQMAVGHGATEAVAIADLIATYPREESEAEEPCTCRLSPVNSATIDPPEMIVDCCCPVHGDGGPDPDEAYERMRDEAWEVSTC